MTPSDRGFQREVNAPKASLSTLQKVVRYAEKDDILLYMTAAFGVLMPGLMYFFYRYIHKRYQLLKKAGKKREQPKEKPRTATIFYCSDIPTTKEIAYELAENLHFDPLVAKLNAQEMDRARQSRAIHFFILSGETSNKQDESSTRLAEFLDWLDEVKYERREKNYLRDTRFIVIFIGNEDNTEDVPPVSDQACIAVEKRLLSLEAIQLSQSLRITTDKRDLNELCVQLNDILRRFNYGEFDGPEIHKDEESVDDYSEDEGSD